MILYFLISNLTKLRISQTSFPKESLINIIIIFIIMRANEEDRDQCFVQEEFEEISQSEPVEFKVEITKKINQQMPANELRAALRPSNMAPRTFYLDRPFYLLRNELNQPQRESVSKVMTVKQKLRICNSQNLNIEDYFSRKKFRCVYNKLATFRNDSKSFLGKLKGVDLLIDYNWKSFKELDIEIDLFSDRQQKSEVVDSDFEGGNLCRAYLNVQSAEKQYFMLIENDLNTYGYNNWFFFRVKNNEQGFRGFSIVNFIKKTNFFNQGMLISIFSMKRYQKSGQGWFKGGHNITFGPVNLTRQHHDNECYYTLYFQYDFPYEQDEVYFALSQPYTYTRLINFLENTTSKAPGTIMQVKPLGYSIANNIIPMVRIYNQKSSRDNAILIIARQHPCQTVGSFIAEKMMSYLLQNTAVSSYLTENFEIMVIPMVNPDGVIHGNSRTNMAGLDLNRHWGDNILKELTPQTMKIKHLISSISKVKQIKYMIDLHGHGKKLNSFFFCCKGNEKEGHQLLSLCMNELEPRFNLFSCTFGISKDKQNTLRSQLRGQGIKNSYTLETSLFGWKNAQNEVVHFNEKDYEVIAENLAKSIFLLEADAEMTERHIGFGKEVVTKKVPLIMEISERQEKQTMDNTELMSDSDPEGDKLDVKELLGKCENKLIKKKLQENFISIKKNGVKNHKKLSSVEANQSIKNLSLRESYAPSLTHNPNINSTAVKKNYKPMTIQRLQTQPAKNKPIKAIQFHQKPKDPPVDKKKLLIESLNLTRPKMRARIKTEANTYQGKEIKFFSKNPRIKFKNEDTISSLKSQKVEFRTQPDDPKPTKRHQIELRFSDLKKQSISLMLTDTISIFKVRKERQKSTNRIHILKNVSLEGKKDILHSESCRQGSPSALDVDVVFNKARHLQQLVRNKGSQSSKFRPLNSVYYHFPVL